MNRDLNRRGLIGTILLLYMAIAYIAIQTDFARMRSTSVAYSDGVLYLTLDIVVLALLMRSSRHFHSNAFISSISIVGLIQVIVIMLSNESSKFVLVCRNVTWFLMMFGLYEWLRNNKQTISYLINVFATVLMALTILIIYQEITLRNLFISGGINTVYWVELGLPVAFLVKNSKLKYTIIGLIGVAVFISLKATAMIAFVIPLLFVALVNGYVKNGYINKYLVFLVVICFVAYLFMPDIEQVLQSIFGLNWAMKLNNSMESGGSGRTEIWEAVVALQFKSTIGEWMFGHGYGGVIASTNRLSAHNDFLEVLFDYGLFAFVPYVCSYFYLFGKTMKMIKKRNFMGVALGVSLIQFWILSFFSHLVIYPWLLLTLSFVWSICFAENSTNKNVTLELRSRV